MDSQPDQDRLERAGARRGLVLALAASAGAHAALVPSHAAEGLLIYAASRTVVVWPLAHVEPIDAVGVVTKLLEAAGLLLALSLLRFPSGSDETLHAVREGVGR